MITNSVIRNTTEMPKATEMDRQILIDFRYWRAVSAVLSHRTDGLTDLIAVLGTGLGEDSLKPF